MIYSKKVFAFESQGLWTETKKQLHINALQVKVVMFAVKAYTTDKRNCHVQIKTDNTTAIAYVNKMGRTKSPDRIQITKDLGNYYMSREIMITAEHLPGSQKQIADYQSREYRNSSNWKLRRSVFLQLEKQLGPWQVDLFADRVNAQKTQYFSWKPHPGAVKTDAFTVKWQEIQGFAFPPFCLIGRCLVKIRQEQATLVLVTPTWQT